MAVGLSALIGFKAWLLIELTLMLLAGGAGVWLFYVQHQFADAYWTSHDDWDYTEAALQGSSFYKLPAILRWFSGKHRLPPHPSPQPADPQLSPAALPQRRASVWQGTDTDSGGEPQVGDAAALG